MSFIQNRSGLLLGVILAGILIGQGAYGEEGGGATGAKPGDAAPVAAEKKDPPATAESNAKAIAALRYDADILWTCIAAFLVFFMQAGFAMVEAGFTRAKNAVNILMKNLMDFSIGAIAFWAVGFGLMFAAGDYFGWGEFFVNPSNYAEGGKYVDVVKNLHKDSSWVPAFWIFQCVFCATAATIVSGAMAERTKFTSYLIYTVFISAIIYPVFGSWAWGNLWGHARWLANINFHDFAGSTVVHSVGGWAALAGAIVLGARKGKYGPDGSVQAIPGHSLPLAALGVFILWLGWFGFNPGSTTSVGGDLAAIAMTTCLSAAAGAIGAMFTSWIRFKKADAGMTMNGVLAGLVAITAPCDIATNGGAIMIGLIAGVIVVFAVLMFDKLKIDDPVGAISVHGVCGVWGTLACALSPFITTEAAEKASIGAQLAGIGACFVWTFGAAMILFLAIKHTIGLRVSEEDEIRGLDLTEHGAEAYALGR